MSNSGFHTHLQSMLIPTRNSREATLPQAKKTLANTGPLRLASFDKLKASEPVEASRSGSGFGLPHPLRTSDNAQHNKEAAIKKETEDDDEIILLDSDLSGNYFCFLILHYSNHEHLLVCVFILALLLEFLGSAGLF